MGSVISPTVGLSMFALSAEVRTEILTAGVQPPRTHSLSCDHEWLQPYRQIWPQTISCVGRWTSFHDSLVYIVACHGVMVSIKVLMSIVDQGCGGSTVRVHYITRFMFPWVRT